MLQHRMDGAAGIFEMEVDGSIDAESYRAVVRDMEAAIETHGQISLLETITSIGWISPEIWLEDLFWSSRHMGSFSRVALVTDTGWLASLAATAALAFPVKLKTFALSDIAEARAWLTA
ncbi:MAG TPA: STAS/SEC14 domain-containing protein [Sphingobium sp.]